jgi:hypothetical protein
MAPSVKMPANMSAMLVPKGSGYFCNPPKISHYSASAPEPAVRKGLLSVGRVKRDCPLRV